MLISVCIPCRNRTHDLKQALPSVLEAAKQSLPIEIVVLDYGSQDDLEEYIKSVNSNIISYYKYNKPEYYHMAHAYNLCARLAKGEWVVILGADIIPSLDYFKAIREHSNASWIRPKTKLLGIIAVNKEEFIAVGGYDERFEFYGPEDKDIEMRLIRHGGLLVELPDDMLTEVRTKDEDKLSGFHPRLGGLEKRQERREAMRAIYMDNRNNDVIVVNQGKEWGKW